MDNRTDKIERRRRIANATGGCNRCPPHRGDNRRGRRGRPDSHKNHRS